MGEDGVAKLACGDDFPGNAFKAFQQECLRLKSQGMILAILSKNNPDAITAFETHPGMVLRPDDFVATRINWAPKPENIRALAKEINVGLDSFVFLDDSPHEREAMRRLCPEVQVPEMPADPALRPFWLRNLAETWPIRLTGEDARRSEMYLAERKAKDLRTQVASLADYLKALSQTLTVAEASAATLPRVAQMHGRTNQFNLTTRRFTEADIAEMMADPAQWLVLHGQVRDKFGDHGIVICATVRRAGKEAVIETFLMSCRVIGREVERAFLGALLERLASQGVQIVRGAYIPTAKNAQVRDFYEKSGFEKAETEGETQWWRWEAGKSPLLTSDFVEVIWERADGAKP